MPPEKKDKSLACSTPVHRERELELRQRTHKGMQELVSRYLRRPRDVREDGDRVNVVESHPSAAEGSSTDSYQANVNTLLAAHKVLSTIIGRLNRKWKHNEQLFVRPCSVIVSRCTFYHAEGLESCNVS